MAGASSVSAVQGRRASAEGDETTRKAESCAAWGGTVQGHRPDQAWGIDFVAADRIMELISIGEENA